MGFRGRHTKGKCMSGCGNPPRPGEADCAEREFRSDLVQGGYSFAGALLRTKTGVENAKEHRSDSSGGNEGAGHLGLAVGICGFTEEFPKRSTEPRWRTRHTYTYATTHGSTGIATPAQRRTRAMEARNSAQLDFFSATALSAAAGWTDCSCALIQSRDLFSSLPTASSNSPAVL